MRTGFRHIGYWAIFTLLCLLLHAPFAIAGLDSPDAKALQTMVEADWTAQEQRKNRTPDSPEAIRDV